MPPGGADPTLIPHSPGAPSASPGGFGVYEVEALLGEGTMGRVYRARHRTLGRKVAIKSLHGPLTADPQLVTRFLQEARLVNAINHPHIVECHDFVESSGAVYAVMELLEGQTLGSRLASGPLRLAEVLRIATQVAEALEAAHALSVVHRDLKPDNLMLIPREGGDWVKVLDFGIAKLTTSEQPRVVETQAGVVMGTPRYMAPEQLAALEVDARADIYSWGAVVHELVSGRCPFESENFALLASDIITRPAAPLPALSASGELVPEWLRALTLDCLAKQPGDRPASMTEVLERLHSRTSSRRRALGPFALALAAGLAVTVGFAWLRPAPLPPPLVLAEPAVVAPPPPPTPESAGRRGLGVAGHHASGGSGDRGLVGAPAGAHAADAAAPHWDRAAERAPGAEGLRADGAHGAARGERAAGAGVDAGGAARGEQASPEGGDGWRARSLSD